jgi:hypothetical protein
MQAHKRVPSELMPSVHNNSFRRRRSFVEGKRFQLIGPTVTTPVAGNLHLPVGEPKRMKKSPYAALLPRPIQARPRKGGSKCKPSSFSHEASVSRKRERLIRNRVKSLSRVQKHELNSSFSEYWKDAVHGHVIHRMQQEEQQRNRVIDMFEQCRKFTYL